MAVIVRIDVDRPYGKQPLARHILSRVASDFYLPKIGGFGFLSELGTMLECLKDEGARAYVFFRRCTLPNDSVMRSLEDGRHYIGLHLEDSRSFNTFVHEKSILERHFGKTMDAMSKHGSGNGKFGFHHYPPYEPNRYLEWATRTCMRLVLGNLEDPCLEKTQLSSGVLFFPSAFWLEPSWRDTKKFTVQWLIEEAHSRDIVLLVHPENTLGDDRLISDFKQIIKKVPSKVYSES